MMAGFGLVTATDTTAGAGVTVSGVLPLFVASKTEVAMMVVLPAVRALTCPVAETVATAVLLDDHVTAVDAPLSTVTFAVIWRLLPTTTDGLAGVTTTETTVGGAGVTVTETLAEMPGANTLVARTLAVPGATPVIDPFRLTATICGSEDVQVTAVDAPPTAVTVAVSWRFAPTVTDGADGAIVTAVTAG